MLQLCRFLCISEYYTSQHESFPWKTRSQSWGKRYALRLRNVQWISNAPRIVPDTGVLVVKQVLYCVQCISHTHTTRSNKNVIPIKAAPRKFCHLDFKPHKCITAASRRIIHNLKMCCHTKFPLFMLQSRAAIGYKDGVTEVRFQTTDLKRCNYTYRNSVRCPSGHSYFFALHLTNRSTAPSKALYIC